jgi:hypothetical protein
METAMNTMETAQKTIEDLAALQAKSFELHAAFFSTVGRHLAEDVAEIEELGRTYFEALAKADSFGAAFQVGVDFEDNAKEKLKDIIEVNSTALEGLGGELASLFKLKTEAGEAVKPAAPKKRRTKAKAKAAATA